MYKRYIDLGLSHAPNWGGTLPHNPGTCPDWESNWQLLGLQAGTQPIEPHQPGRTPFSFFKWLLPQWATHQEVGQGATLQWGSRLVRPGASQAQELHLNLSSKFLLSQTMGYSLNFPEPQFPEDNNCASCTDTRIK